MLILSNTLMMLQKYCKMAINELYGVLVCMLWFFSLYFQFRNYIDFKWGHNLQKYLQNLQKLLQYCKMLQRIMHALLNCFLNGRNHYYNSQSKYFLVWTKTGSRSLSSSLERWLSAQSPGSLFRGYFWCFKSDFSSISTKQEPEKDAKTTTPPKH